MTMQNSTTGRVLRRSALVAVFAAAIGAHPVSAGAADPGRNSIMVHYGDLNLSTKEGIEVLHRRIGRAAKLVCDNSDELRSLEQSLRFRSCVNEATNRALEKVQMAVGEVRWEVK
jgi:UrcA family protein